MSPTTILLPGALLVLAAIYSIGWARIERRRVRSEPAAPDATRPGIGFGTNFFDTLGIGSFAPTTALFRLLRIVRDEQIPGTLNIGQCLPTVLQGLIFIVAVAVDPLTLVSMIAAAVIGRAGARASSRNCRRARFRPAWAQRFSLPHSCSYSRISS